MMLSDHGLGLGFKYISTILKGSEHELILRFPSYRCVVMVRVRVRVGGMDVSM